MIKQKSLFLEKINHIGKQINRLNSEKIPQIIDIDIQQFFKSCIDEQGQVREELGIRELLQLDGQTLIEEWVGDKKGIIIDIGGYFAPTVKKLQVEAASKGRVIGIVEDTENGHQLYAQAIRKLTREETDRVPPIITVARSQIKDSEDYNVGKAITDAVDHILRTVDYTHLAESKTILIIGYGKIGSAAATVASEKTRGSVLICEKEPVRRLKASAHSFPVVELETALPQADVIICCTGNKCLTHEHLSLIKDNAYIGSCTSKDGEFDKTFLSSLNKISIDKKHTKQPGEDRKAAVFQKEILSENKGKDSPLITRYTIAGKTINLLNDGNSVNFVEKAVHGYFIQGVLAALATAAIKLYLESPFVAGLGKSNTLQKGYLNDFNDLIESTEGKHYQSVISAMLMQEKLRKEPFLSNYQRSSARYLPRDNHVKKLNILLNEGTSKASIVHVVGGKKYGKSQIIEEFFALRGSRYDIVWKFDALSPLEAQFKQFALKINSDPKIVNQIGGAIKFEEGPGVAKNYSPWGSKSITHSNQVSTEVKQIQERLEKADLPYLLIFEDIDLLSEIGSSGIKSLKKYLPKPSGSKREHIIFTSGDKTIVKSEEINPIHDFV